MNRRDTILQILLDARVLGRPLIESELLGRVHDAGDTNCTPQALRMQLRGLGDKVRNPVYGPIGMARWEASGK